MDDLRFVQACVKGDKQSWEEFLSRYSRLIYNYIHSVLNVKGSLPCARQAEDIFQDLFYSLIKDNCRKLATYRGRNGCSLASWLRQVTINFTIDYLRKSRPVFSIDTEIEPGVSLSEVLRDFSPDASEFLSKKDRRITLQECIDLLEPSERYFMELLLNQGLSLEQIRGHLEISRGAVDMRRSRVFQKLQDCFKRKGFELDPSG
ncbi:MAG: RNA polymerase sigma factor [Candidatus Omnitrophica bacterium]|nr:RNA polymerase sigma factor [Candidatus Omnitrophota bacterium]MDD5771572.1 RNA polymerase sigma factor [Candidatus Omnitrophota bacterium]